MFNTARRFLRLRQANGYCHGPYSSSEVWQIIRYNEGMIGYRGLFYDEDRPRTREGDDPMGRGTPYTWVLEDLTGEPVSYEQVMPPRRKRPKGRFSGRRRPHYHCLLRYPRTRRVLRDGAFPDPEGAPLSITHIS